VKRESLGRCLSRWASGFIDHQCNSAERGGFVNRFRTVSLWAATITTGLVAGVFVLYAHTIMPGLARTDDRTFVAAFQSIDRMIINPWFIGGCFYGAVVCTVLAAVTQVGRSALPWILAALVLYLVTVGITLTVNVPRNDALKAAGLPESATELAAIRARFDEASWRSWNILRVIASTFAFGLLSLALVVHGRSGSGSFPVT
jgi:uncharacterized membrane protein